LIFPDEDCEVETYDVSQLSEDILKDIEADTYWCLSNLLDGIQDNYTFAQPGVQKKVNKLRELTKRVDGTFSLVATSFSVKSFESKSISRKMFVDFAAELHAHLENEQIEYLQFSFRWMNNLLMRELPLRYRCQASITFYSFKFETGRMTQQAWETLVDVDLAFS